MTGKAGGDQYHGTDAETSPIETKSLLSGTHPAGRRIRRCADAANFDYRSVTMCTACVTSYPEYACYDRLSFSMFKRE